MPFLSPNQQCQSTEGKNITFHVLAYPKLTCDLPTLFLTTNRSWLPWGGFPCLSSALNARTPIHNTVSWFVKMSNRQKLHLWGLMITAMRYFSYCWFTCGVVCFWQPSCTCTTHDSSTTSFTTSDSFQHASRLSTCWPRAWWWVAAVASNAPENISCLGKSTGPVSLIFLIVWFQMSSCLHFRLSSQFFHGEYRLGQSLDLPGDTPRKPLRTADARCGTLSKHKRWSR